MEFISELGYAKSQRFFGPERVDDLPANELAFALRLAVKECQKLKVEGKAVQAQFQGAYLLQDEEKSQAIPIVFLVRVESDAVAREVHRLVWNLNQAPFLIVESPSTVRVYPGFSYERDQEPLIPPVLKNARDALEQLAAFRASSIDHGTLWKQWAHSADPSKRVNETLLRDLKLLDSRLQKDGLSRATSHGLIGNFVYLWYLRDRDILSDKKLAKWGIEPEQLFTGRATLKAFHTVRDDLQTWLNGSVFSLGDSELSKITPALLRRVAGVFHGGSLEGEDFQQSLFEAYDFSHIPIETLSCVYEQFLHDTEKDGISRGKTLGAYYTPLPLTDYVLSELERRRLLKPGMRVLDPACGSGAFLVQCYRRLIEKQRRKKDRDLEKRELRKLLTDQVFGIDRDDDACRLTELSLIMTLLDYVQPPDLEDTTFKLPRLRDQNIFQGDFFESKGTVHDLLAKQRFDWIVGNPPWAEVKSVPAANHEHYLAYQWMAAHKRTHPTSGNQIAEAFVWKAGEHLTPTGICALVAPAMTWFKKEATSFRQRFFSERRVWHLANFANLNYVLFSGSERPASVIFFESGRPSEDDLILTFAPFVAEQVSNRPERPKKQLRTWNIVVGGSSVREIPNSEAKLGNSLTWKLAMWGTSRDRKLLGRLDSVFKDDKSTSLQRIGIEEPSQGFEVRPATGKEKTKHHPELKDKTKLLTKGLRNIGRIFAFPPSSLGKISSDECYVRIRGGLAGLAASRPPHVIVDAARRFAVFSNEFIAIPPRQIGIAGKLASAKHLQALSLYLSSDFFKYHQFFTAPKWGIDESIADLDTLKAAPIPIAHLSVGELLEWVGLQDELSEISKSQFAAPRLGDAGKNRLPSLLKELNERVFRLLGLKTTERWLVEDFVGFQTEMLKGKVTPVILRQPTSDERESYLEALRSCLDGFLSPERAFRHRIEVLVDGDSALLSISLVRSKTTIGPVVFKADETASQHLKGLRDRLRSKRSQWIYFDRNLKIFERGVLYQFKPLQRLHWTRRQAVLDADDMIAETLVKGGVQ